MADIHAFLKCKIMNDNFCNTQKGIITYDDKHTNNTENYFMDF